jgi:hypothetical protein
MIRKPTSKEDNDTLKKRRYSDPQPVDLLTSDEETQYSLKSASSLTHFSYQSSIPTAQLTDLFHRHSLESEGADVDIKSEFDGCCRCNIL